MAAVATDLIHGRLDTLVAAGARAWEFGIQTDLGLVLPNVHAKIVSEDGQCFTVGSANLDGTASSWESEALLIVEDPDEATRMEARLDRLLEASVPIDPHDPRWRLKADRRRWFVRHWPALVG